MNKAELGGRLAERTSLDKAASRHAVDGMFAIMREPLAGCEKIRNAGIGTFDTRNEPVRTGRTLGPERP